MMMVVVTTTTIMVTMLRVQAIAYRSAGRCRHAVPHSQYMTTTTTITMMMMKKKKMMMMTMMTTILCVQAVAYGSSGMVQARQYPMACD